MDWIFFFEKADFKVNLFGWPKQPVTRRCIPDVPEKIRKPLPGDNIIWEKHLTHLLCFAHTPSNSCGPPSLALHFEASHKSPPQILRPLALHFEVPHKAYVSTKVPLAVYKWTKPYDLTEWRCLEPRSHVCLALEDWSGVNASKKKILNPNNLWCSSVHILCFGSGFGYLWHREMAHLFIRHQERNPGLGSRCSQKSGPT